MSFNCGIVGLPNVGKSTLFNALTRTAVAQAANYPFCTIKPNTGRVFVPDARLDLIAQVAHSARTVYTQVECVDIAGLVKGASRGEGLGNAFLGHVRSVQAILHVVRCFEDSGITHVDGSVDPVRDIQVIETELLLADLESVSKRISTLEKKAKGGDEQAALHLGLCQKILPALQDGITVRSALQGLSLCDTEYKAVSQLMLLTDKPMLYVCNVHEAHIRSGNQHTEAVGQLAAHQGEGMVIVSAAIEAEISQLDLVDQTAYLQSLDMTETGLARVVRCGYELLNLLTFFTAGPKEARAWTVHKGSKAPQAAGAIHSDFEIGFICAEIVSYHDFIANRGEIGAKSAGKWRQEGRDYVMHDGDVVHFRFNR